MQAPRALQEPPAPSLPALPAVPPPLGARGAAKRSPLPSCTPTAGGQPPLEAKTHLQALLYNCSPLHLQETKGETAHPAQGPGCPSLLGAEQLHHESECLQSSPITLLIEAGLVLISITWEVRAQHYYEGN